MFFNDIKFTRLGCKKYFMTTKATKKISSGFEGKVDLIIDPFPLPLEGVKIVSDASDLLFNMNDFAKSSFCFYLPGKDVVLGSYAGLVNTNMLRPNLLHYGLDPLRITFDESVTFSFTTYKLWYKATLEPGLFFYYYFKKKNPATRRKIILNLCKKRLKSKKNLLQRFKLFFQYSIKNEKMISFTNTNELSSFCDDFVDKFGDIFSKFNELLDNGKKFSKGEIEEISKKFFEWAENATKEEKDNLERFVGVSVTVAEKLHKYMVGFGAMYEKISSIVFSDDIRHLRYAPVEVGQLIIKIYTAYKPQQGKRYDPDYTSAYVEEKLRENEEIVKQLNTEHLYYLKVAIKFACTLLGSNVQWRIKLDDIVWAVASRDHKVPKKHKYWAIGVLAGGILGAIPPTYYVSTFSTPIAAMGIAVGIIFTAVIVSSTIYHLDFPRLGGQIITQYPEEENKANDNGEICGSNGVPTDDVNSNLSLNMVVDSSTIAVGESKFINNAPFRTENVSK